LILGGGFGGISVAYELRTLLGTSHEHEIVLIDRSPAFTAGFRKLWDLVGHSVKGEGTRFRELLAPRLGIKVIQDEIVSIDPNSRSVTLSKDPNVPIIGDNLVIALGAESRPELVPGLAEYGYDVWTSKNVQKINEILRDFKAGRIVVLIAGAPYPCPPAPYECLFLIDSFMREKGMRDKVELMACTIQPLLMPNAGPEGSAWMLKELMEKNIKVGKVGGKLQKVEKNVLHFEGEDVAFDLLLTIPPHRPPKVVLASPLVGQDVPWIKVTDPGKFTTSFPNVYAIGDCTLIPLANGLPLPKAGLIAEMEGRIVAKQIASSILNGGSVAPWDGKAYCFIEVGFTQAARVEGDWYKTPKPGVAIGPPDAANVVEKAVWESGLLKQWWGA
jgi:sulfide:quinone oxidoreductase